MCNRAPPACGWVREKGGIHRGGQAGFVDAGRLCSPYINTLMTCGAAWCENEACGGMFGQDPWQVSDKKGWTMSLASEFKAFVMRGNVVDMAVGIIIGGAFGKIVASLVNDVVMPPIGMLLGGVDFSQMAIVLKKETVDAAGNAIPAVTLEYGLFINAIVNFLIVAAAIFAVIRLMNSLKRKEEAAPAAPPAPSAEEKLLTEIRDILQGQGQ